MEWLKRQLRGTAFHRIYQANISRFRRRHLIRTAELNESYDDQVIEVMRRILRPDSNCIDIGAHIGAILQHMIAIAPAGTHHAIEPIPHLAAALREKFPAVRVHESAISDHNGEAEFQFVENAPAYSGLRRRIYDRPDPKISTLQVQVATVDDLLPKDQAVAFIKIDIEGGEYHAIKGAARTIKEFSPVVVFEAGKRSTGQYGVTPSDLYNFVVNTLDYELSTMARWLGKKPAMTHEEFCHNWDNGPDFYFIASPAETRAE